MALLPFEGGHAFAQEGHAAGKESAKGALGTLKLSANGVVIRAAEEPQQQRSAIFIGEFVEKAQGVIAIFGVRGGVVRRGAAVHSFQSRFSHH